MDEFAQTRGGDDLFDDDFTPLEPQIEEPSTPAPSTNVPRGPAQPVQPQNEAPKSQAVRGDRSGTGGVKKPKLTENELVERMAAAKINAQKRSEAHARAEADEASFQEREKMAAEKRRADAQNRRVMDGERERNRQRKLNAQAGRDWDAEKNQEDFNATRGGRGQFRRGAHGGVPYDGRRSNGQVGDFENAPQADEEADQRESYRGRGRGRGRGGGRGRGRGDFNSSQGGRPARPNNPQNPAIGLESEFPALPGGEKAISSLDGASDNKQTPSQPDATLQSPLATSGNWADQVQESNDAATKE